MTILRKLFVPSTAALLLAACATQAPQSFAASGCDVSWLKESRVSSQKACELRALAKRCAVSDRCYINCEAKGGAPEIGGGCLHICMGGAQADRDIATNGGLFASPESVACFNSDR